MKPAANSRDFVVFNLNGQLCKVGGDEALLNLSDYLRRQKNLTGTKIVCSEGDCGACSVLRAYSRPNSTHAPDFEVINSCITRVAQLDGSFLLSIEGIAHDGQLDSIQQSMIECNASQCGFCTPGFVMAMADHFEDHCEELDPQKLKNALTGNLCRCTGYESIISAGTKTKRQHEKTLAKRYISADKISELGDFQKISIAIQGSTETFFAPSNEQELSELRNSHPNSIIMAAGTDLGVQKNKHDRITPVLISLHLIPSLYRLEIQNSRVQVGARVTLTELRKVLKDKCDEICDFLNIFASPQIKNVGTLVGNIANASPIADTPPMMLALNAEIQIWNPKTLEIRSLKIDQFYLAYKKINLSPGEVIFSISFDLPQKNEILQLKKLSQRRDLDISTVNTAFFKGSEVGQYRLAVGGVAATPLRLKKTEGYLQKNNLNPQSISEALKIANSEISPISDLRGSDSYRRLVLRNLLQNFLSEESNGSR